MDFETETEKLEEILRRYTLAFRGYQIDSYRILDEWRQATHMALERAHSAGYEIGYEVGQNGEVNEND
jgi:hypothetical protein